MWKRATLFFLILACLARTSLAIDHVTLVKNLTDTLKALNVSVDAIPDPFDLLRQLIASIQSLTSSVDNTEVELNKISTIGQQLLDILNKNQGNFEKLAEISSSINGVNSSVNEQVPGIQSWFIILGSSIVIGSLICVLPKFIDYCRKKKRSSVETPLYFDAYSMNSSAP